MVILNTEIKNPIQKKQPNKLWYAVFILCFGRNRAKHDVYHTAGSGTVPGEKRDHHGVNDLLRPKKRVKIREATNGTDVFDWV
jgi:hypothetical protein